MSNGLFRCAECGGKVTISVASEGSSTLWRMGMGVSLPIPAGTEAPICEKCGEFYFDGELSDDVERALRPQYVAIRRKTMAAVIDAILRLEIVNLYGLSAIAGEPIELLEKMRLEQADGSILLQRLLEAYSNAPEELRRAARDIPWSRQEKAAP